MAFVDLSEAGVAPPAVRRPTAGPFFRLAGGFWKGETRRRAWLLTIGVFLFVFANLAAALAVNRWNKYFFDALERKDTATVVSAIGIVVGLALLSAAFSVGLVHMRMRLQLRWRQWLTGQLIARWLADRRFYQLTIVAGDAANPEYRIADDGRLAIEPLVDFIIGLSNALLAAVAFVGVLWVVGGSLEVGGITIPGYMVFAALIYSGLTSFAMLFLGRPLVSKVEEKNAGEAKLRYELTRVRESAENIALIGGDDDERVRLNETFSELAARWLKVIVQQAHMTWVGNANAILAPVIPLLLGAPKYLSGDLSLGSLMQAATAFAQVQIALNWLADNAIRLAEWFASSRRVIELTDTLDNLDATIGRHGTSETINLGFSPDDAVHIKGLSIAQQDGKLMIDGADAVIEQGEKVLVKGVSGTGKSTLIRAMAGLWPWGVGDILRPEKAEVAYMPQRPYIPLGSLRTAILYPQSDRVAPDASIHDALRRCGLSHLIPRLDDEEQWSSILSGGEQQRLAFARIILNPPDIVIMDEATSALDEVSEACMMEFLRSDLARSTVIHVGHRPGIEEYHDREIHLVREAGGTSMPWERQYSGLSKMWSRLRRQSSASRPAP